jgi:hypothetical protein
MVEIHLATSGISHQGFGYRITISQVSGCLHQMMYIIWEMQACQISGVTGAAVRFLASKCLSRRTTVMWLQINLQARVETIFHRSSKKKELYKR